MTEKKSKVVKKVKEIGEFKDEEKKKAKTKHEELAEVLEQTDAYLCFVKNKGTISILTHVDQFEIGTMLKEVFDQDEDLFHAFRAAIRAYEDWKKFNEANDMEKLEALESLIKQVKKHVTGLN